MRLPNEAQTMLTALNEARTLSGNENRRATEAAIEAFEQAVYKRALDDSTPLVSEAIRKAVTHAVDGQIKWLADQFEKSSAESLKHQEWLDKSALKARRNRNIFCSTGLCLVDDPVHEPTCRNWRSS